MKSYYRIHDQAFKKRRIIPLDAVIVISVAVFKIFQKHLIVFRSDSHK